VTAACDRGCTASVGLLVTKEMKRKKGEEQKRATDRKSTQLMGMQGIINGKLPKKVTGQRVLTPHKFVSELPPSSVLLALDDTLFAVATLFRYVCRYVVTSARIPSNLSYTGRVRHGTCTLSL